MQEKKKTEKRKTSAIRRNYGTLVGWLGIVLFTSVFIWRASLDVEQKIWSLILCGAFLVFWLGGFMTIGIVKMLDKESQEKAKRYHIYRITIGITTVTMFIVPLILQGVYRATEDNIVITENTSSVSEQIIYFTDEDEIAKLIQVLTEKDAVQVTFEENVQPYVEVMQYCTTVTTDNQNPWGRKYTETVKEWKQYEFHFPLAKTNN